MTNHILKSHDMVDVNLVRGENCDLYDDLGNHYIDLESGCWCTCLGHANPRIVRVIQDQVQNISPIWVRAFQTRPLRQPPCWCLILPASMTANVSF